MAIAYSVTVAQWLKDRERINCPVVPLHVSQFYVLSDNERTAHEKQLDAQGLFDSNCGCLAADRFPSFVHRQVEGHGPGPDSAERREVRKWLFDCGVPFRTPVRVHQHLGTTIETTWKMLIRYWPLFYGHGFDDAVVTDRSFQWALSMCHHGPWIFGTFDRK